MTTEAALAVDLGGTNLRAALVTADGVVTGTQKRRTPREDPRPDALVALVKDVLATAASRPAYAVIGVPGRVDHAAGRCEHAPNLPPRGRPT